MKSGTESIPRKDEKKLKLIQSQLIRNGKGSLRSLTELLDKYKHKPQYGEFWYKINSLIEGINDLLDTIEDNE